MKVAVLLSGGVDSSLALALLARKSSLKLEIFYLKIWLEEELAHLGDCPWKEDLEYCKKMSEKYQIPLNVVPLQQKYLKEVVDYSIMELEKGYTPSPDIICNQKIKFGAFIDYLNQHYSQFDKIASGHYAQVKKNGNRFRLYQAPDPIKDQTYFLSRLSQQQLSQIIFPIGHYNKEQVRQKAIEMDLPSKDRKDSQGICFLGKIKYNNFVKYHLGERNGSILDIDNKTQLGEHRGAWFHTIGQRQGLGLSGGPWYVVKKDIQKNIIWVSHRKDLTKNTSHQFLLRDIHWIDARAKDTDNITLKLRHGPEKIPCKITKRKLNQQTEYTVNLAVNQLGIAPGQSATFYLADQCLGSGTIEKVL